MSKTVNRLAHAIRRYLSRHASVRTLKLALFGILLALCLCASSITLFSLYAVSLHHELGMSYLETNTVAALLACGLYLFLPVLGYLSDCHGPSLLAMLSMWFFIPSYLGSARIVRLAVRGSAAAAGAAAATPFTLYGLAVAFFFVGLATSSLYFSSLLTCARIYPHYKGLAILLPVTCYGMSSLILAQLMKVFEQPHSGRLDLERVFGFYVYLYLVVGALNFVATSVVSIESDIVFEELAPLLAALTAAEPHEDALLAPRQLVEPVHHHERYVAFLRDPSAWLLLVSLMLSLGPMELFQNNLGLIITCLGLHASLPNQVSVMASMLTASRLVVGVLLDYLSSSQRRWPLCKVWLLAAVLALGAVGQAATVVPRFARSFDAVLVVNGFAYGGAFTVYPTVIALVWGIDIMGSTWGSFMVATAVGSIGFLLLYGKVADADPTRLAAYFSLTTAGMAVSVVMVLAIWRGIWYKRGLIVF